MQHFYEKLMGRMSGVLKPVSSARRFKPKKIIKETLGFQPFITISREPGSGGRPIAKKLSQLTGFQHYNKQLIEKVAKNTKRRKKLIESIDERGRSSIEDFAHSLFNPDYMSDIIYIRHLSNVILTLAEKGAAVILGRGANFFTSHERGLHVRISAPYSIRIERAVKHEKLSEKKAKSIIQKVDADRKQFVRQYFKKNISNPNYYDLVLNTTYMTINDAAKLILKSFEHKFPGYLRRYKLRQRRLKAQR